MNSRIYSQILDLFYPTLIIFLLLIFNIISLKHIFFIYIAYCFYIYFTTKTSLTFQKTSFNLKLINNCPSIKNANFKQYFLFPFTFAQFFLLKRTRYKPKHKLIYTTQKTDQFGTEIIWVQYEHEKDPHSLPVFLIVPGITGKTSDSYNHNLVVEALNNNYDVVVFQMRTLSAEMKMENSKFVNFVDDLENSLKIIKKINKNEIFAAGFSYGANTLVTYLGTKNLINKDINYAIAFSNPYSLYITERIGHGTLYESLILHFSKKNYIHAIKSINKQRQNYFDIEKLKNANTIKDFDKEFFGKLLGFDSGDDYYKRVSSEKYLLKVNIPLLLIHSKDDPITSYKGVPFDDIEKNENLILISTDRGGHCCFIGNRGYLKTYQWLYKPAIEFFNYLKNNESKNNYKY